MSNAPVEQDVRHSRSGLAYDAGGLSAQVFLNERPRRIYLSENPRGLLIVLERFAHANSTRPLNASSMPIGHMQMLRNRGCDPDQLLDMKFILQSKSPERHDTHQDANTHLLVQLPEGNHDGRSPKRRRLSLTGAHSDTGYQPDTIPSAHDRNIEKWQHLENAKDAELHQLRKENKKLKKEAARMKMKLAKKQAELAIKEARLAKKEARVAMKTFKLAEKKSELKSWVDVVQKQDTETAALGAITTIQEKQLDKMKTQQETIRKDAAWCHASLTDYMEDRAMLDKLVPVLEFLRQFVLDDECGESTEGIIDEVVEYHTEDLSNLGTSMMMGDDEKTEDMEVASSGTWEENLETAETEESEAE